jgi:hypothetical protein
LLSDECILPQSAKRRHPRALAASGHGRVEFGNSSSAAPGKTFDVPSERAFNRLYVVAGMEEDDIPDCLTPGDGALT